MIRFAYIILAAMMVCGCVAHNAGNGEKIDIVTTVSGNPMIDPPMPGQNRVLVKIVNPTDQNDLNPQEAVKNGLAAKGYRLVDYPDQANYTIMGRIVQAGETEPQLLKEAYRSRYGTRLSLQESGDDMLANAVGQLVGEVRAKSYLMIVDFKIGSQQEVNNKKRRQAIKTRTVSGIQGTRLPAEEIMLKIRDKAVHTAASMF